MSAPAPANPVFCALDTVDLDAARRLAHALIVAVTVLTSLDDGDPAAARVIAASLAGA
jgi:hypothetical protein